MKNLIKIVAGISAAVAVIGLGVAAVIVFGDEIKEMLITVREWIYTVKNLAEDYIKRFTSKYTPEEKDFFADI